MLDIDALGAAAAEAAPTIRPVPPMEPGLVVHVDGDMLCYECAGNDEVTQGEARQRTINKIEQLRSRSGAEGVVVHMTSPGCHKGERYLIATVKPYQASRKSGRRPKNHQYLQDWLTGYSGSAFKVKVWATREADDGIAACAYFAVSKGTKIVIATADKDMRMLPGRHVDWRSGEIIEVPPGAYDVVGAENGKQYGTKWFWLQMLQGDAADNIPGLEKYIDENGKAKLCGEKTAEKLLARCKTNAAAFAEVYGLYHEFYFQGGEHGSAAAADDRFCEQAALLWMRTDTNAAMDNFMRHTGPGCISEGFPDELRVAATRMVQRVRTARAEADALSA